MISIMHIEEQKQAENTSDADLEYMKRRYDVYLSERQSLTEARKASLSQFDSGILTLAAGGLGISIALIDKIAPHPIEWTKWILLLSWVAFAMSLLSTLCSFFTSAKACKVQIDINTHSYLAEYEEKKTGRIAAATKVEPKNRMAAVTKFLTFMSGVFFFLGVIFLCAFAFVNLKILKKGSDTPKYDDGSLMVTYDADYFRIKTVKDIKIFPLISEE